MFLETFKITSKIQVNRFQSTVSQLLEGCCHHIFVVLWKTIGSSPSLVPGFSAELIKDLAYCQCELFSALLEEKATQIKFVCIALTS